MNIIKPIIIVGVGRSGSTIFHQLFSEHPNVAWQSGLCGRTPNTPSIMRHALKATDLPIIGKYIKAKNYPGEALDFWEYHCKGFRRPCRDLLREDVTRKAKDSVRSYISNMLTTKRNRLLVKVTGWPRIGYLSEVFPDAKFINVVRDGRAVAYSLMNVDWWWGWRGPQNWRWGLLNPEQQELWERHNRSFIALAGIEWNILMEAMSKAKSYISEEDIMDVKYEDFCSNPVDIFKKVTNFCELDWVREFENSIKKNSIRNTNYKWMKELTENQQKILEDVTRKELNANGYL